MNNKNIILAMILALVVLFGMDIFMPKAEKKEVEQEIQAEIMPTTLAPVQPTLSAVQPSQFLIPIKSQTLSGFLDLKGFKIVEMELLKYKQTIQKDSPNVVLLNKDFYVDYAFKTTSETFDFPNENTVWTADGDELTPKKPLTLSWKNTQGIEFIRQVSMDQEYMIMIDDFILNTSSVILPVAHDSKIVRLDPRVDQNVRIHQGFVGILNNQLFEEKYPDIQKEKVSQITNGGWMGISDSYWLTAVIFNPNEKGIMTNFDAIAQSPDSELFVASAQSPIYTLRTGEQFKTKHYLYTGPKDLKILTEYQDRLGIEKFQLAIDFGWFYFLTKPFLYILEFFNKILGNMGLAILLFATLLRLLLLPIAGKSYESMAKMKKIQPQIKRLQELYKNDRMRLNQEMLMLYKKENINPASGCLPLLIQIPVFFALYKVLSVSIAMRQAPFFGWIQDLSARDPSSVFTLFGYLPWSIPSVLNIGILPVLMGITMYLQQKMSPNASASPEQNKVIKWMPVIFTFMLGNFASGLVLYWTWSNILSIIQQRYVMKKYGQ